MVLVPRVLHFKVKEQMAHVISLKMKTKMTGMGCWNEVAAVVVVLGGSQMRKQ